MARMSGSKAERNRWAEAVGARTRRIFRDNSTPAAA